MTDPADVISKALDDYFTDVWADDADTDDMAHVVLRALTGAGLAVVEQAPTPHGYEPTSGRSACRHCPAEMSHPVHLDVNGAPLAPGQTRETLATAPAPFFGAALDRSRAVRAAELMNHPERG